MDAIIELCRRALGTALPEPLLFAGISGAHLYGFPSPDSDVDLRACHVLPVKALLGLHPPRPAFDRTWVIEGVEMDLVSHDLVKYVNLLLKPHGNFLEQLFSPLTVLDSPEAEELRYLMRHGGISRQVYQPYAGYARNRWLAWRGPAQAGAAPLKPLLYAYRVSLTGLHLLRTGEVNANLAELAPRYGLGHLLELIAAKAAEQVTLALPVADHDAALAALQEQIEAARDNSPLPPEPTNASALDDYVLRVRLARGWP